MSKRDDAGDTDENEFLFMLPRYKPQRLSSLCESTHFSRDEIRQIYQGFKQLSPAGRVDEENFKLIFCQFFPMGDGSNYAKHVFRASKRFLGRYDFLNFEQFLQILSSLSRGSIDDKLRWIFCLYDINEDGRITLDEMMTIVACVNEMMGQYAFPFIRVEAMRVRGQEMFNDIDSDGDGFFSFEDLQIWCQKDEQRIENLLKLNTNF